jgi:hypothetical protein
MAGTRDILLRQNEDFILAVRWKIGGLVQAISDASFTVRKSDEDEVIILEATILDGRLGIDIDNWARIMIPLEVLEPLGSQRDAVYDIRVTRTSDGVRKVLLEGKVAFDFGATR